MNEEQQRFYNFGICDGRNGATNDIRKMLWEYLSIVPVVDALNKDHLSITMTLEKTVQYMADLEALIVKYVPNQIFPAQEGDTAKTYSRLREKYEPKKNDS